MAHLILAILLTNCIHYDCELIGAYLNLEFLHTELLGSLNRFGASEDNVLVFRFPPQLPLTSTSNTFVTKPRRGSTLLRKHNWSSFQVRITNYKNTTTAHVDIVNTLNFVRIIALHHGQFNTRRPVDHEGPEPVGASLHHCNTLRIDNPTGISASTWWKSSWDKRRKSSEYTRT